MRTANLATHSPRNPSSRQIAASCRQIRAQWDDETRERRARLATTHMLTLWEIVAHELESALM